MSSRLFKRAHMQSGATSSPEVVTREVVDTAHKMASKLGTYLDEVQASFRDVRNLHEAERKLAGFLRQNTDLVPGAVISAVETIHDMNARFAAEDFSYTEETDASFPHELLDATIDMKVLGEEPLESNSEANKDLGNSEVPQQKVEKQAASNLLDNGDTGKPTEVGKSRWENFSSEALTEMIQTLAATDGFATDTESQRSVAEMAEILAGRPTAMEMEEEAKGTETSAKAAKKATGGLVTAGEEPCTDPCSDKPCTDPVERAKDPRWNTPNDSMDNNLLDKKSTEMNLTASTEEPGIKDAEKVVSHLEKMIEKVDEFDVSPIDNLLGSTRASGVIGKINDLKEALGQVLNEAKSKVISFEVAKENEEVRKESKSKSSRLRGLQLVGIE
jgi:hypothetical protein